MLTALLLFTAFLLTRVSRLRIAVQLLLVQSLAVAVACVWSGFESGAAYPWVAVAMTVAIKVGLVPVALFRVVGRMKEARESQPLLSANRTSLAAALLLAVTYGLLDQTLPGVGLDMPFGALALFLIGLLIMITRRQAVLQIIGLIVLENGLYLVGFSMPRGLPIIIEQGIFFDLLIAVVVLGILQRRLRLAFLTKDTAPQGRVKRC